MQLKEMLIKLLKVLFGDLRRAIITIFVVGLVTAGGGLLAISKTALSYTILIANTPTPLWGFIALALLLGLYVHTRKRIPRLPLNIVLHPALGVNWDSNFNMHCLSCGTLLKNSSHGPSVFFCADQQCNSKHILKDDTGKELTKQEAVNIVKSANNSFNRT
jgi:hypothetical protein